MGTRADFYVGRGVDAEWIGSIAWDGSPLEFPQLNEADTEERYRAFVVEHLSPRDDFTDPAKHGWPWPWEDSCTTDYAYTFAYGEVWWSYYGTVWRELSGFDPAPRNRTAPSGVEVFPNMDARREMALGTPRDSAMLIGRRR